MKLRVILSAILLVFAFSFSAKAAEQVFFYHTDPAGTPLAMTNSSGAVVWKADYKPFGEESSITGAGVNDRRFVGKEKDEETGLSYFGARYEDAKTGRFIAVDPVGAVDPHSSKTNEELLANPQRLNSYAYGLNNPYRFVDEDGRAPQDKVLLPIITRIPVVGPYAAQANDKIDKLGRQFAGLTSRAEEAAKLASVAVQRNFDRFLH